MRTGLPLAVTLFMTLFAPVTRAQIAWTTSFSGVNTNLNGVAFGNGVWVAVGDAGTIITSPDGQTWTPRASGTGNSLRAVTFGGGRFVGTRNNLQSPALTSTDGINWSPIALTYPDGSTGSSSAWNAIAYGAGKFVAVGAGPTDVMSSSDGVNFRTAVGPGASSIPSFSAGTAAITYDRARFVCCGQDAQIYSTTDVTTWRLDAISSFSAFNNQSGIAGNGAGLALAVGRNISARLGNFETPPSYAGLQNPSFRNPTRSRSASLVGVCFGAGYFVAVDDQGGVVTHDGEQSWGLRGEFARASEGFSAVAYDGANRFVAVGGSPPSQTALIATSAVQPGGRPPTYHIQTLAVGPGPVPRAINNDRQIAGNTWSSGPFIERDGIVTYIPMPVGAAGTVMAMSQNGLTAGTIGYAGNINPRANIFPGEHYPLASIDLGNPSPVIGSLAHGINSFGVTVGEYERRTGPLGSENRAFAFDQPANTLTDLGTLGARDAVAVAINDSGEIVLHLDYASGTSLSVVRSASGTLTTIPRLGGSNTTATASGYAISPVGDIVGASSITGDPSSSHAFVYRAGTTRDIDTRDSTRSAAFASNTSGDVVGAFSDYAFIGIPDPQPTPTGDTSNISFAGYPMAFLYHKGELYQLDKLTDTSGTGWELFHALGINDAGQIVGIGGKDGKIQPFLATPTTGPAVSGAPLINISTRMRVGTGEDVGIVGFAIRGGSKKVIIRAIGPDLLNHGIANALLNPFLQLFDAQGVVLAQNDNWKDSQQVEIMASGFPPTADAESAIVATLPEGNYTAIVRGVGQTTGIAVVEVYDLDITGAARLVNISTRARVGTGENVVIAGFVVAGHASNRVMIRGLGPSLASSGVVGALQDPSVTLYRGQLPLALNDNWRVGFYAAGIESTGLAPGNDLESALTQSLGVGAFTIIVSGNGQTTGVGLVEVYELH